MEKCILITGACGGLGRAFVKECAKEKKTLVLTGTSQKKLDALLEDLKECLEGVKVFTAICNLAKPEDRKSLVEFVKNQGLQVARLINNAGVIIEGDLLRFEDDEIINAVRVNCEGTLDITQKFLKARDENEKFEVLTISSVASSYPIPHFATYAATKAFLTSMMTALAIEFKKKNVVFTTVNPGGMATTDAMKESIKSMGLGGRLSTVSVEKVAKVSLKALKHKKVNVIPGFFNKILVGVSKPFSKKFMAVNSGKLYAKSQSKRNF